jgi:hypothetical protein
VVPLAFEDGKTGQYNTQVVGGSELPALVGVDTFIARRVIIDHVNMQYIEIGPGNHKIDLPPGSRVLPIHRAPTGHLLLPISEWDKAKPGQKARAYTAEQ